MNPWSAPKRDISENAAKSPHVLVLEIAACAKPIDFDCDCVLAGEYIVCYVELRRRPAVDAVSDIEAVDPEVKRGINSVEGDKHCPAFPLSRKVEISAIAAYGISLFVCSPVGSWLAHDPGLIRLERIQAVYIDRCAVALDLPVGGHVDVVPSANVVVRAVKILWPVLWRCGEVELPNAIERATERRLMASCCECLLQRLVRHQSRMRRFLVDPGKLFVLNPWWYRLLHNPYVSPLQSLRFGPPVARHR